MNVLKVTDERDGELRPRMYSYWPNAVVKDGNVILVFVGHVDGRPRFYMVNRTTGEVSRLGPLLKYTGEGEGWYWNREGQLYLIDGPRLRRVGPLAPEQDEVVFDISETHPGCDLWQAHSSDDGRVHSATVRQVVSDGTYPALGTIVVRDGEQIWFPAEGYSLDESQVTSDGAFVVIKSSPNDDNLVINLTTGEQRWLMKPDGALGHSDVGPSYMVGADRDHEPRACVKWDLNRPLTMENRILLAQSDDWSGGDLGHVSIQNGRCIISDGTYIHLVDLERGGKTPLIEHGMVSPYPPDDPRNYDFQVKANLAPSGNVACYMTNMGNAWGRQDVFLLIE